MIILTWNHASNTDVNDVVLVGASTATFTIDSIPCKVILLSLSITIIVGKLTKEIKKCQLTKLKYLIITRDNDQHGVCGLFVEIETSLDSICMRSGGEMYISDRNDNTKK